MGEPRQIDWGTAVVTDGALDVELTGAQSRRWSKHMEAVLARLETRRWGPIEVTKRRVKVRCVEKESADELRHLLESAAQQTNSDLLAAAGHDDETETDRGRDEVLTDAFRALAADHPAAERVE